MRFDTSRCLACTNPGEPGISIGSTGYWVCKSACYEKAWLQFLDKRYALDKDPVDDPEAEALSKELWDNEYGYSSEDEEKMRDFFRSWRLNQRVAIEQAK